MSTVLPTPLLISEAFGKSAANPTYITLPIPVPDQTGVQPNLASFDTGFPPNAFTPQASGGLPFFGQDLNGLLWMITAYIANLAAGKFSSHDPAQSTAISGYPFGALLLNDDNQGYWSSIVDGNTTDPDAGGAGWYPVNTLGFAVVTLSTGTQTLAPAEWRQPMIAFEGTLTGNVIVILPKLELQWLVVNATSGAFTVTVKTAAGAGVVIPQTSFAAPTTIYCDFTDIHIVGVSTAGLAPINSPALTGTPTGPTAPSDTNTAQLATCAFVQQEITEELATYAPLASPTFAGVPTAPTPAANDNSLKLASTQYVDRAIAAQVLEKNGSFNCTNGTVSVAFATPFPTSCSGAFVQWAYTNPDVGFVVPGSVTRFGFQYANGNAGACYYFARGS